MTVKVFDHVNVAISNAKIELVDVYGNTVCTDTTDDLGICNIKDILAGSYFCKTQVKNSASGLVYYNDSKYIQVLSGKSKDVELFPYNNTGIILLSFNSSSLFLPGSKVALVLESLYDSDASLSNNVAKSFFLGQINSNKEVSFTSVPTDNNFVVIVYYGSIMYRTVIETAAYIYSTKDKTNQFKVAVYNY